MPEELPKFDPLAHCVKCGNSIPEPVKVEIPNPAAPPGAPKAPAKKAAPKKPESAAAQAPQAPGYALPPQPSPPTVEYCNGNDCPWGKDTEGMGEHMHQFCDVCGYEWLSKPLG